MVHQLRQQLDRPDHRHRQRDVELRRCQHQSPDGITAGPDRALWFTNTGSNTIGRITTAGKVTSYTGTGISRPREITTGPDGALWFTNNGNNSIGRITTTGTVTNFTGAGIFHPDGITTGPDGALWFTNTASNSIGRITTAGTITKFKGPGISEPQAITAGPDGALWFTNFGTSSIGRITTSGTVTNFIDPSINHPEGITAGPDGALWFTNFASNTIGRITTAGKVTSILSLWPSLARDHRRARRRAVVHQLRARAAQRQPTRQCRPDHHHRDGDQLPQSKRLIEYLTRGPDGALWFPGFNPSSIGRITTAGDVTYYVDGRRRIHRRV